MQCYSKKFRARPHAIVQYNGQDMTQIEFSKVNTINGVSSHSYFCSVIDGVVIVVGKSATMGDGRGESESDLNCLTIASSGRRRG